MSCKNCGGNGCKSCERVVITKQGERGFAGPPGPQGQRGFTGVQGNAGANGTNGTNGTDGEVILYRSLGETDAPTTINALAYVNSLMPNDNDGLRITYIINETADNNGNNVVLNDNGVPLFTWTASADQAGVLKVIVILTRSGNDMVGHGVAMNVSGSIVGTYSLISITNWFLNISSAITITSTGNANLKYGELTIERLLSI